MSSIRVSAKAIIIKDKKILLLKHEDKEGDWYSLPGGGQDHGEKLSDTLIRECQEEIGADVEPGDILFIRDYIGKNHEFKDEDSDTHQIEIMFSCFLPEGYLPTNGLSPDSTQKDVIWIEISELHNFRLYPKELVVHLQNYKNDGQEKIYLGDVN